MIDQNVLMQLIIILPLLAIPGIIAFGKWANLREAVTLIAGGLLLVAVIVFFRVLILVRLRM